MIAITKPRRLRDCEICGTSFTAHKTRRRFCSQRCAAHDAVHARQERQRALLALMEADYYAGIHLRIIAERIAVPVKVLTARVERAVRDGLLRRRKRPMYVCLTRPEAERARDCQLYRQLAEWPTDLRFEDVPCNPWPLVTLTPSVGAQSSASW